MWVAVGRLRSCVGFLRFFRDLDIGDIWICIIHFCRVGMGKFPSNRNALNGWVQILGGWVFRCMLVGGWSVWPLIWWALSQVRILLFSGFVIRCFYCVSFFFVSSSSPCCTSGWGIFFFLFVNGGSCFLMLLKNICKFNPCYVDPHCVLHSSLLSLFRCLFL